MEPAHRCDNRDVGPVGPVGPVDPSVFQGRGPEWRLAWDERLTPAERAEVRRAVRRGARVDDPHLEPYVYGFMAIRRRELRSWLFTNVPIGTAFLALMLYMGPRRTSGVDWFWVGVAAFWITAVPLNLWWRTSRLRRAERLNAHGRTAPT